MRRSEKRGIGRELRFEASCGYEKLHQSVFQGETARAWISRSFEDTCWDSFLQKSPPGQFQQSSMWARAKAIDGWKPVRVVITMDRRIIGGFQILAGLRWWGRIGYVSKGPVVSDQQAWMADYATELLRKVGRSEKLLALVVQPPDCCAHIPASLASGGFRLDSPVTVYRATWIFNLGEGVEALRLGMARQTRRKLRQAAQRGVSIREGSRRDLGLFFELMLASCQRQGVQPNPPTIGHLFALWDAAHPVDCIRLFIAECNGNPVCGLICIAFGKTFTMWKRGWSGAEDERHPNELITGEALRMAAEEGFDLCDYSEFDEKMAMAIRNREPLTTAQERSRHSFITRFGGMPRLLPASRLYLPNSLAQAAVRLGYKLAGKKRLGGSSPFPGCFG